MPRCFAVLLASIFPTVLLAATDHDLRNRITIDGDLSDFVADEWVVDTTSTPPEPVGDSRWGIENDVYGLAVTWDDYNLYIGIPAVTVSTSLMLALDTACGGLSDLTNVGTVTRNVTFTGLRANAVVRAELPGRTTLATIDCDNPLNIIDPALFESAYVRRAKDDGAFEIAIPWERLGDFVRTPSGTTVPGGGVRLRTAAFVTGGFGTGAGDALPDPSIRLENDSTRVAILNNYAELNLDGNNDGLLDTGVTPRSAATFALTATADASAVLPLRVVIETKLVEPDRGTPLSFYATLDPADYAEPVYLTASIYSADGRLMTRLYENSPRDLSPGSPPVVDTWDGRDHLGNPVPGGIYIVAVSGGPGSSAAKKTVKASFAIVR